MKCRSYVEADVADDAGRVVDWLEDIQYAGHRQRVAAQLYHTPYTVKYRVSELAQVDLYSASSWDTSNPLNTIVKF